MTKSFEALVPSIAQRESAWMHLQERLAHLPKRTLRPTLTLSREFGCEAFPLAERLKALLESRSGEPWNIYDKALIERVARDEQLSLDLLERLGDGSQAMDVLKKHFGFLTQDEVFTVVVKHLVQVARAGNAIVVGRGGAVVCQDLQNCLHIRLEGGFDFRVSTIARRMEVPLRDAEDLVRNQSKLREKFVSECLQTDITHSRWYHAVLNNERLSVEAMAKATLLLMEEVFPDLGQGA